MIFPRVIPVLLINKNGLYKTIKFRDPKYVGDPLNAVSIFNKKEVDELIILDFRATIENRRPDFKLIENIASRCFMPLCYGGGIRTLDDGKKIISSGVEKISLNSIITDNPGFIEKAANAFGSSAIIVSVDVRKNLFGKYEICTHSGTICIKEKPEVYVKYLQESGAGEIFLNNISNDGTMNGYDLELISNVCKSVSIPVIVCGSAGNLNDFKCAINNGASAVAAGSYFVFHGKHRGVLISYPSPEEISWLFNS